MGFSMHFRSTRPVDPSELDAIKRTAATANDRWAWTACEPVHFYPIEEDGHLLGGCKVNLQPHPDDVASAASEGLSGGTCRDAISVLCQLSREHQVDWALSHDYEPELGFIRGGVCDERALGQIEALADVGDILADFDEESDAFP